MEGAEIKRFDFNHHYLYLLTTQMTEVNPVNLYTIQFDAKIQLPSQEDLTIQAKETSTFFAKEDKCWSAFFIQCFDESGRHITDADVNVYKTGYPVVTVKSFSIERKILIIEKDTTDWKIGTDPMSKFFCLAFYIDGDLQ